MLELKKINPILQAYFAQEPNVLVTYIFGSYCDGFATVKSDLDLAVLFRSDLDLWQETRLQSKICEALRFDRVDLLNLNKAPLRLKFMVLATGNLVYEAEPIVTSDFVEAVLLQYHDREYRDRQFFKEWDAGLREDYLNGESG
jgi:predicted nucleotidyltransferase